MTKKKHNVSFIIMIIALLITAFFFGYQANQPAEEKKGYMIGVILPDSSNTRWQNLKTGIRAAAGEYDIQLTIVSTGASLTSDDEVSLIQDAVRSGSAGIITEIIDSGQENHYLEASVKTPVCFVENPLQEGESQVYSIDNETAAESLMNHIRQNHEGTTIGIVNRHDNMYCNLLRLEGIQDKAGKSALQVIWTLNGDAAAADAIQEKQNQNPADILICLDNDSTEAAIDAVNANNSMNVKTYGFGSSSKCIYNTDSGIVADLIVPDSYVMGYSAVKNIYSRLMREDIDVSDKINYRMITKANLFTEKNQQILFPVS